MSAAAENWVRANLSSHIDDRDKIILSEEVSDERSLIVSVKVSRFAELFASAIEAGESGLADRMKSQAPRISDDASDAERAEALASGHGFNKYIDQWVSEGLLT